VTSRLKAHRSGTPHFKGPACKFRSYSSTYFVPAQAIQVTLVTLNVAPNEQGICGGSQDPGDERLALHARRHIRTTYETSSTQHLTSRILSRAFHRLKFKQNMLKLRLSFARIGASLQSLSKFQQIGYLPAMCPISRMPFIPGP
jgi:hypothetical protein